MNDFVRDETSEQFTIIPHWLFASNLTAMERLAWIAIVSCKQQSEALPSIATIAQIIGVKDKRTSRKAIEGCIEKGYLVKSEIDWSAE